MIGDTTLKIVTFIVTYTLFLTALSIEGASGIVNEKEPVPSNDDGLNRLEEDTIARIGRLAKHAMPSIPLSRNFSLVNGTSIVIDLGKGIDQPEEHTYTLGLTALRAATYQSSSGRYLTYISKDDYIGWDTLRYSVHRAGYDQPLAQGLTLNFRTLPFNDPELSHYVPGHGTVDFKYGIKPPVQLDGVLPCDIVIASVTGLIERIDADGTTVWRNHVKSTTRSVSVLNGEVYGYKKGAIVRILDFSTGGLKRIIDLSNEFDKINFVNAMENGLLIGGTVNAKGKVILWTLEQGVVWINPHSSAYPRWAARKEDVIVIADTFGSRIYGTDMRTSEIMFSKQVHYPNDVRFLDSDTLLITAEHEDTIYTYNISSGFASWVYGSHQNDLKNMRIPFRKRRRLATTPTMRIDPADIESKSKSSVEYSGRETLYAPNGAVAAGTNGILVADTDNHRVVYLRKVHGGFKIFGVLEGFNNPSKIGIDSAQCESQV